MFRCYLTGSLSLGFIRVRSISDTAKAGTGAAPHEESVSYRPSHVRYCYAAEITTLFSFGLQVRRDLSNPVLAPLIVFCKLNFLV